ncbi:hypothetical protein [Absidia glauca]|uniref:SH3 domain-containing protein n=1 Tax=Absidia glauca TaxID=4829 RepID=A0A163M0B6_ABSGL|nr:hypothetical protein [Absidia glauca]
MFSSKDKHKSSVITNPNDSQPPPLPWLDHNMTLPRKIIKATKSHSAHQLHILSFEKGDFFHVVGRENDAHWYAVNNPLTNLNGLVPVNCFDVVDKAPRTLTAIQPDMPLDYPVKELVVNPSLSPPLPPSSPRCYGTVLYDFVAEGPDELDCKANEAVLLITLVNNEWYLAKSLCRRGKYGLVPVSFVQLGDVPNDLAISASSSSTANSFYRRSNLLQSRLSISSSRSDQHRYALTSQRQERRLQLAMPTSSPDPHSRHSYEPRRNSSSYLDSNYISIKSRKPSKSHLSPSTASVVHITVNSFIWDHGRYCFVLFATVNSGKHRILYRTYEDFYHFHLRLLQEHPQEEKRLPSISKPTKKPDDLITERQREELDDYCKHLLAIMPTIQHTLFELTLGDVETDYAPKKGSRVVKSAASTTPPPPIQINPGMIKVKIVYQDDIFAVKLPTDCTLAELHHHIEERLHGRGRTMMYKNDLQGTTLPLVSDLDMEEAFSLAIQRGKLTVVVE